MLANVPAGESPAGGTCSVASVVISGGGKGDRPDESPEVKAPVGWEKYPVRSWCGGLSEARKIATAAHTMYPPVANHNCGGPVTHFANWHLAMATPNLKILETVRRHYNDRFLPVVAASGAPQNGRLGVPPGPGLGVEIREEFLRSGKLEIDFVDEGTADRSRVVWGRASR